MITLNVKGDKKMRFKNKGFTLIEVLVIIIIVIILAALALTAYTRSVNSGKTDRAKEVLTEVFNAVERFNIDRGAVTLTGGLITMPASYPHCKDIPQRQEVNVSLNFLFACGYLKGRNWENLDYTYHLCTSPDPNSHSQGSGNCSSATAGRITVAYMQRRQDSSRLSVYRIDDLGDITGPFDPI